MIFLSLLTNTHSITLFLLFLILLYIKREFLWCESFNAMQSGLAIASLISANSSKLNSLPCLFSILFRDLPSIITFEPSKRIFLSDTGKRAISYLALSSILFNCDISCSKYNFFTSASRLLKLFALLFSAFINSPLECELKLLPLINSFLSTQSL